MISAHTHLDEATRSLDAELFEIETEIDWLTRLSPNDNAARWEAFVRSGFITAPPLTYPLFDLDIEKVRSRLDTLALGRVTHPVFHVLLDGKRTELLQLLTLLEARDTDAFPAASVAVFGDVSPDLLADAHTILDDVRPGGTDDDLVGAAAVVAEAEAVRAHYASLDATFDFAIEVADDADVGLMVHHGDLLIARHLTIPRSRVGPLIEHEVGVHVLTRHNGRRQPLRLFESGLANYDRMQEGLATFCEYLAGNLPAERLRVLAARVVAADLALAHHTLASIFHVLHDEYALDARPAFDVALRATRGGALTKDAVYLGGLRDVLAWLADGGDIAQLFVGKYALRDRHLIADLLDEGVLAGPALLPRCLTDSLAADRLDTAIATPVTALHH